MNQVAVELPEEYQRPEFGAKLLSGISIFKNFSSEDLVKVYGLGELRVFNPGANIIIEGENTSGLFLVIEGMVGIYKQSAKVGLGNKLATLGQGKSFGEMSLIDKRPRSATVATDTRTVVYHLDGTVWDNAMQNDLRLRCQFFENCAMILSSRLRELDDEYILSQKQLWRIAISRAVSASGHNEAS